MLKPNRLYVLGSTSFCFRQLGKLPREERARQMETGEKGRHRRQLSAVFDEAI